MAELVYRKKAWQGSAAELLEGIEKQDSSWHESKNSKDKSWPNTAQEMGTILKTQVPNLEKLGIEVDLSQRSASSRIKVLRVGSFNPPEDLKKRWSNRSGFDTVESLIDGQLEDTESPPF